MKYAAWVALFAGVAMVGVWTWAWAASPAEPPAKAPTAAKKPKPPAVNDACFVCHVNYDSESLAETHRKAGVGCVDCHGESSAHRNDENNITPPERMYWAQAIDPACVTCHGTHDAPARDVIALWQKRGLTARDAKSLNCTDCHGEHRLPRRSVLWDKKTGALLPRPEAKGKG